MKHCFRILLFVPLFFFNGLFAQSILNPCKNWQFRKKGDTVWMPATVPGTVHTDLFANGKIPDPFADDNEKKLQWIENEDWEYSCTFDVDSTFLLQKNIVLVFEGLDTYAKVYLNDKLLLTADNMFRQWEIDCKSQLRAKKNQLKIIFESAVKKGRQDSLVSPYILPGDSRVFTRKAQYQYGWDWGPRFVTCGIWKAVYLKSWENICVGDVQLLQQSFDSTLASLSANIEMSCQQGDSCNLIIINNNDENILQSEKIFLRKGQNQIHVPFEIEHPQLWWPNGYGKQYLYELIILILKNDKVIHADTLKTGIRKIELVQKADSIGKSFYFKVNDAPVFMKGTNFIPADNFLPRVSKTDYENLVNDAAQCNMNMLRVWGGGTYADDYFYKLCDEKGVLVWQDFMFACAMYPGDSAFLENVKQEIICNVKKLRNHSSIALWCGNNEIDEGWKNWEWQKQFKMSSKDSTIIWKNYLSLFDSLIPSVLKTYDPVRPYWPSSPQIGWGRKESLMQGDSHYWGVWWGMEPFSIYKKKIGRFMSEYGFQGFPVEQTVNAFSADGKISLTSKYLNAHEKHPTGFETISSYMKSEYKIPTDLDNYIYVSELLQANGMKTAIDAHRMAKPYCMGSLYWQFNDCWPVVSWSGSDYFGRWKAMQYIVKKAFQPIVVISETSGGMIKTSIASDEMKAVKGILKCSLIDFSGIKLWEKDTAIIVNANSSQSFLKVKIMSMIKDTSQLHSAVFMAKLFSADSLVSEDLFYFYPVKNLKLKDVYIQKELITKNEKTFLKLKSNYLAKNICITLDNKYIKLSDNYFDLLPNESIEIRIPNTYISGDILGRINIQTINQIN